MDLALTYDLTFIAPKRRPQTPPELVFIINEKHLGELIERLLQVTKNIRQHATDYLAEEESFRLPIPDLFGKVDFGYNSCGYAASQCGEVHLHLPLRPGMWMQYCCLTIHALTIGMDAPFETPTGTNRTQGVILHTISERGRPCGYGHAIGGYACKSVNSWLREYARPKEQNLGLFTAAPMHTEVIRAMQSTWHAICHENTRKYASPREIYGYVRKSGSFLLACFGDACDMGVYPNSVFGDSEELVNLSCHNLDNPVQQLTLLAGLAKICQLSRDCS